MYRIQNNIVSGARQIEIMLWKPKLIQTSRFLRKYFTGLNMQTFIQTERESQQVLHLCLLMLQIE